MIKQKILGATLAVLGLVSIIPTLDITAACFFVPLGVYMMFTRENVLDCGGENDRSGKNI